jgi:hypothetical protein
MPPLEGGGTLGRRMSSHAEPTAGPTTGPPAAGGDRAETPDAAGQAPVAAAPQDDGPSPATVATVWSPTTPARHPTFRDDRLRDYRHPSERPALVAGLAVIAVVVVVAYATGTAHYAGLGLVAIWLALMFTAAQQKAQHLASSVQVSQSHLPRVYRIAQELGRRSGCRT